jgi:SDR family mycofactocin-dependent oxidoreductase
MPGRIDGKVAFITGAARGQGRSHAIRLAQEGADIIAVDICGPVDGVMYPMPGPADLAETVKEVEALDRRIVAVQADVRDFDALKAAVDDGVGQLGRLDIVVANAGIVPPWHETDGLDLAEWDRVFAINARGVAATIKHAVPLMRERGGAIVVTASVNALKPHPRQMAYTATKHATVGIVRTAALDLGRFNIRVNGLAPGPIATAALRERVRYRSTIGGPPEDEALRALAKETPLGRIATEREVAQAALFLASDLASAITGHLLPIDAGLSAS